MFPPNNPHYPRNRSCTRCLNGTKRKGLYAVFTIGVFLCIIFAVTLRYEHHVLDVSKQHVLSTMHQSYNAESPNFVNESRRRAASDQEIRDRPLFVDFKNEVDREFTLLQSDGTTQVDKKANGYQSELETGVTNVLKFLLEKDPGFAKEYMGTAQYPLTPDQIPDMLKTAISWGCKYLEAKSDKLRAEEAEEKQQKAEARRKAKLNEARLKILTTVVDEIKKKFTGPWLNEDLARTPLRMITDYITKQQLAQKSPDLEPIQAAAKAFARELCISSGSKCIPSAPGS